MHKNPKISIIMPSYNRAHFLPEAIESCLNQTFTDFELIIIDDCSKDDSIKIATKYAQADSRITIIANKDNKKLPATLNIGFLQAKGEYFTWISDDNAFQRNALEKMNKVLDTNKDIGLVYSDYNFMDDNSKLGKYIYQEPPEFLPIRDCVGACFLYRANIAKKLGGYNENMFLIEDYEYWLRMGLVTKLYHIPESLYLYRTHEGSLTKTRKEEIRLAKNNLKKIFAGKYTIPPHLQPIDDLYMWFIGERSFLSYMKMLSIILIHPITTISYIFKNLRRINIIEMFLTR